MRDGKRQRTAGVEGDKETRNEGSKETKRQEMRQRIGGEDRREGQTDEYLAL